MAYSPRKEKLAVRSVQQCVVYSIFVGQSVEQKQWCVELANSGFRQFLEWGIMGNNAVQVGPVNLRAALERRDYLFMYLCFI